MSTYNFILGLDRSAGLNVLLARANPSVGAASVNEQCI